MSLSESVPAEVPAEVLALAVSIAMERRRLAAGRAIAVGGEGIVDGESADEVRWRWGPEVGGWS